MHATDQLPDQPHDSQAERVAWYALLALPAVVPTAILPTLMTATNPYGSSAFTAPKFLVLGLLVAVALGSWAVALVRGDVAVRDVPTKWWMLAFLALAGVSTATALNHVTAIFGHAENLVGLITFLMCASVWFLATQLVTGVHRMRLLARSVIIGGAIVAFFGVLQALQVHPFGAALAQGWMPDRAASTVGNPDFTGTYLVFPVILSVAVGLSDKDARWRAAGWATFVACSASQGIGRMRRRATAVNLSKYREARPAGWVADVADRLAPEIAVGQDLRRAVRDGALGVHEVGGERLPFDVDETHRFLGDVLRVGGHSRDLVAGREDLLLEDEARRLRLDRRDRPHQELVGLARAEGCRHGVTGFVQPNNIRSQLNRGQNPQGAKLRRGSFRRSSIGGLCEVVGPPPNHLAQPFLSGRGGSGTRYSAFHCLHGHHVKFGVMTQN